MRLSAFLLDLLRCAVLAALFFAAMAVFSSASHAIDCRHLLLKLTNQVHHIRHGNFSAFRTMTRRWKKERLTVRRTWVKLSSLTPLHPINYANPWMRAKWQRRVDHFRTHQDAIISDGHISSLQAIKIDGRYIVKDGNSRLFALREVFDDIDVEVDEYIGASDTLIDLIKLARDVSFS